VQLKVPRALRFVIPVSTNKALRHLIVLEIAEIINKFVKDYERIDEKTLQCTKAASPSLLEKTQVIVRLYSNLNPILGTNLPSSIQ
jgi:hypothetical protein